MPTLQPMSQMSCLCSKWGRVHRAGNDATADVKTAWRLWHAQAHTYSHQKILDKRLYAFTCTISRAFTGAILICLRHCLACGPARRGESLYQYCLTSRTMLLKPETESRIKHVSQHNNAEDYICTRKDVSASHACAKQRCTHWNVMKTVVPAHPVLGILCLQSP